MSQTNDHMTLNGVVLPLRPRTHAGPDEPTQDAPTPPPVDEPDEDESWLARQRRRELPELPPMLPSREQVREIAGWAVQWGTWHARRHARRTPRYAGRVLVRSLRASGRGVRWWARWVYSPELAVQARVMREHFHVVAADSKASDGAAAVEAAIALRGLEMQHTKARKRLYAWRTGKLAATAATGYAALEGLGWAADLAGGWVYPAAGLLAMAVGAVKGRRPDEAPLMDAGSEQTPVRIDLAPEHLNAAFRAAGLLKGDTSLILSGMGIGRQGAGWATVVDLPRGGGKTAADVIAKRDTLAAELGIDEIQLIMRRVRAAAGGHAGRLSIWIADDDPYLGDPNPSQLIDVETFDFWKPVPFGRDAQGNRIDISLLWQSAFFGGLPRRGKTFSMRLLIAAAVLDPWVRVYGADGKGGADIRAVQKVAHTFVHGADEAKGDLEAFEAMLDELIIEMTRRFAFFATLPTSVVPEGKLTPQIMRKYNLPLILIPIDELQEYLDVMEKDQDRSRVISKMARIARRGPAAGFIPIFASQRPDAKSVPTKLREIVSYRYCTQVTDKTSSDMVLGDGKARTGADASTLSEEHVGVGVLVTGPASHVTVKADYLDNIAFEAVCERGRALRVKAGTLSGQATGEMQTAKAAGFVIPPIVADVLEAMGSRTRIFTDDLLAGLVNLDEDTYGDYDGAALAQELEAAGVVRSSKQIRIGDQGGRAGYNRRDIEAIIPPDILTAPGGV